MRDSNAHLLGVTCQQLCEDFVGSVDTRMKARAASYSTPLLFQMGTHHNEWESSEGRENVKDPAAEIY